MSRPDRFEVVEERVAQLHDYQQGHLAMIDETITAAVKRGDRVIEAEANEIRRTALARLNTLYDVTQIIRSAR